MQHDMKNPRLPCKTRLASNPCNGLNTGSMLRCKTAKTNKMESKKGETISHVTQDVQVPPTAEGQRTNNMHQAKPGQPTHGERRKKEKIGRWAGLQRERPQARSIQLQRGPPTTKGRTTRPLRLRPRESEEKERSGGAAPPGKQGKGRSKARKQASGARERQEGEKGQRERRRDEKEKSEIKLECNGLRWGWLGVGEE